MWNWTRSRFGSRSRFACASKTDVGPAVRRGPRGRRKTAASPLDPSLARAASYYPASAPSVGLPRPQPPPRAGPEGPPDVRAPRSRCGGRSRLSVDSEAPGSKALGSRDPSWRLEPGDLYRGGRQPSTPSLLSAGGLGRCRGRHESSASLRWHRRWTPPGEPGPRGMGTKRWNEELRNRSRRRRTPISLTFSPLKKRSPSKVSGGPSRPIAEKKEERRNLQECSSDARPSPGRVKGPGAAMNVPTLNWPTLKDRSEAGRGALRRTSARGRPESSRSLESPRRAEAEVEGTASRGVGPQGRARGLSFLPTVGAVHRRRQRFVQTS